MPTPKTIYCDEAGFTGNNLLDEQQDVFAYAAIAIAPRDAEKIRKVIVRRHRLQGVELKGSKLLKSKSGRAAVSDLLKRCEGKYQICVHLKPFALACKLFEYIFEPPLAEGNSIFYGLRFHLFIANLLYAGFRINDQSSEALFKDFMRFARDGDIEALEAMFPGIDMDDVNPIALVGKFAKLHREVIAEEVLRFRQAHVQNWLLDLTTTSFFSQMTAWGCVTRS